MGWIHYSELTMLQAGALAHEKPATVLLLPVGAVEPHGPHAPLGTDEIIATAICERAARALAQDDAVRALVLPAIAYGVTRYAAAFPGVLGVDEETLKRVVVDVCRSAMPAGHGVVIVNHHFEPENVGALRAAVAELDSRSVALFDLTRRRMAERLTDEFRSGSCHAGRYETSLVLAEHPELVGRELMAALPEHDVDMPARIAQGDTDFESLGMREAYCGAPARATAEEGDAVYATLTEMLIELIRELAARE